LYYLFQLLYQLVPQVHQPPQAHAHQVLHARLEDVSLRVKCVILSPSVRMVQMRACVVHVTLREVNVDGLM
jgi:hypothetical protein